MKTPGARALTRSFPKLNEDTNGRLGNYQILEEIGQGGMGVIVHPANANAAVL